MKNLEPLAYKELLPSSVEYDWGMSKHNEADIAALEEYKDKR